jgi:hypothetical protein
MTGVCEKCGNKDQDESYCQVEGCPWKEAGKQPSADAPVPDVEAAK